MRRVIHHGHPTVRRGVVGSHVTVHLEAEVDGEWSGIYHFPSHGLRPHELKQRLHELQRHHALKVARLNGFVELRRREIAVAGAPYRITDCNVQERGRDVELLLGVDTIVPGEEPQRVFSMDHRDGLVYPAIEAVPTDDEIEAIVRVRIEERQGHRAIHAAFVDEVAALLEG